jgi:hypothetical protein
MRWNWKLTLTVLGVILLMTSFVAAQGMQHYVYLPIVRKDPTYTPTPTPTRTPTPSPTATSVPVYTSNGIRGDYFRVLRTSAAPNQDIWFEFSATNISAAPISFGGLGAVWETGAQASWGDGDIIQPGGAIVWNDHLNIPSPGTYHVRLGVCRLATRTQCHQNLGQWETLSDSITVVIQ